MGTARPAPTSCLRCAPEGLPRWALAWANPGDSRDPVNLKRMWSEPGLSSPPWWPPPAAWPCDPPLGLGSPAYCRPPPLPGASSPAVGPPGHEQERHTLGAKLGSEITPSQTGDPQPRPRHSWQGVMSTSQKTDRALPCTCSPRTQKAHPCTSPTWLPCWARRAGISPARWERSQEGRRVFWANAFGPDLAQPRPPAGAVPAEPVRMLQLQPGPREPRAGPDPALSRRPHGHRGAAGHPQLPVQRLPRWVWAGPGWGGGGGVPGGGAGAGLPKGDPFPSLQAPAGFLLLDPF